MVQIIIPYAYSCTICACIYMYGMKYMRTVQQYVYDRFLNSDLITTTTTQWDCSNLIVPDIVCSYKN